MQGQTIHSKLPSIVVSLRLDIPLGNWLGYKTREVQEMSKTDGNFGNDFFDKNQLTGVSVGDSVGNIVLQ